MLSIMAAMGLIAAKLANIDFSAISGMEHAGKVIMALLGFTDLCFFFCWVIWVGGCHKSITDVEGLSDTQVGAGFALSFLCFLFVPPAIFLEFLIRDGPAEKDEGEGGYDEQLDDKAEA